MASEPAGSDLPPLYARWMAEFLPGPIPPETEAPCLSCPLRPHGKPETSMDAVFDSGVKCCTYVPDLPNYLVGRILAEPDPAMAQGKGTVEFRLQSGDGVTPLGLGLTHVQRQKYVQVVRTRTFGKDRSFHCPHHIKEGGLCGIWKHRNSVCATWFCRHVRGGVGYRFWKAVHRLLVGCERALTHWCLLRLHPEPEALVHVMRLYRPVVDEGAEGEADLETRKKMWGSWWGRKKEYYGECARLVEGLGWDEVLSLAGSETRVWGHVVRDSYRALFERSLPTNLHPGAFGGMPLDARRSRAWGNTMYQPVDLPSSWIEPLSRLSGERTDRVREMLRERGGMEVTDDLLLRLVDLGILSARPQSAAERKDAQGTGFFS